MLFGLCASAPERMRAARDWGFDFVEIGARAVVPFEPGAAWHPQRRMLEDTGATITHLAGFVPVEVPLIGPDVDWVRFRDYVDTVVGRAAEVGVRTYNWGSAVAKKVPDGWSYSRAFEQLEREAHVIADAMERHDGTCAIEPINPRECNIVYYLTDAMLLAKSVGRPAIRVIADYLHMALQNEPFEHVGRVADWLAHAHTSGPERYFPKPTDPWDHLAFLRALKAAGYDRAVGFECSRVPPGADYAEEARAGVAYIRKLWAEA
ncbi:MAG TPA: TIM barrel protein [Chloroflexota bacterium]|jgi:sugar phosphate isomerase/epimerase|nr:TIM barrel protein [Chloroflexota bacterium]